MSQPRLTTVFLPSGITVEQKPGWLYESCPSAEEHDPFPADFNASNGAAFLAASGEPEEWYDGALPREPEAPR